jgi:hypothetical protein
MLQKNLWFYIKNHAPHLPTKLSRPPVVRGEWNLEPSGMEMIQVRELLEAIEAQKKEGVTGASVMFSFYKRRVQPIQQRCCLGFKYTGPADPSRMCTEEVLDEVALQRVQRVLLDVNAVPYVPTLFSMRNPPPPVSIRLLSPKKSATAPVLNWRTFCRDTRSCTAATRRSRTSPERITSSLLQPRQPRRLALLRLKASTSLPNAWTHRRGKKPKEDHALLPSLPPRWLALLRFKAAASPPSAWTRKRVKEPKGNRAGRTPPTRAWS